MLTAREDPATPADEPARFVTDPNGRGYGTGIVARGATAEHGEGVALQAPPQPHAAGGTHITPTALLKRQPALLGDGCRGYFPGQARSDQGEVSIIATVRASGAIERLEIESESPAGDGFAGAARHAWRDAGRIEALNNNWETLVRRGRGYRDLERMVRLLRFMVVHPIRRGTDVERFLALAAASPAPAHAA